MTTMLTAPALAVEPLAAPPPVAAWTPRLRRMRYEPEPGTVSRPPRVRTVLPPELPVPAHEDRAAIRRALAELVRLAMEVLDGRRPPGQLARHFEGPALRYWRAAAEQRRTRAPAKVTRMLLCLPRAGAAEIAAVCEIDGRIRALAARFDRDIPTAPWRCTAVRLG